MRDTMWTAGHMNIDTLNAYCRSVPVTDLPLCQGRLKLDSSVCCKANCIVWSTNTGQIKLPRWVDWVQVCDIHSKNSTWCTGFLKHRVVVTVRKQLAQTQPIIIGHDVWGLDWFKSPFGVSKLKKHFSTWHQGRLPAEFKHINKRRKRKQLWFP